MRVVGRASGDHSFGSKNPYIPIGMGFQRFYKTYYGTESEVLSELLGICTVGQFSSLVGLLCRIMLKATRPLPDGSQTDRHSRNGRRAITMTTKHIQKDYRSFPSRKKRPNKPGLDYSLDNAKGNVSWLAKLKKANKRKRN